MNDSTLPGEFKASTLTGAKAAKAAKAARVVGLASFGEAAESAESAETAKAFFWPSRRQGLAASAVIEGRD